MKTEKTSCCGELTVILQINGKIVSSMLVPANICMEPLKALAFENEKVAAIVGDRIEKDVILDGRKSVNIIL